MSVKILNLSTERHRFYKAVPYICGKSVREGLVESTKWRWRRPQGSRNNIG
jgi:hypothetical protein